MNKKLLLNYIKAGRAVLTSTNNVYHLYKISDSRCILWFSCSVRSDNSEIKTLVGKENRFLHYKDIVFFKQNGFEFYDWGGISKSNPNDSIASFKKSFSGGVERYTYGYTIYKGNYAKLLHKVGLI